MNTILMSERERGQGCKVVKKDRRAKKKYQI